MTTAMAAELNVPAEDIANTQAPATELVVEFVAEVTNSGTADLELSDISDAIVEDLADVSGTFKGVSEPEMEAIIDTTAVREPEDDEDDKDTDPVGTGTIVAGVVGGVVVLAVAGFFVVKRGAGSGRNGYKSGEQSF